MKNMEPIELLQKHCEFRSVYDCYVLLAVSRKKDTPEITNSQEIVFREVIKREEDIIRKYNKMKSYMTNYKDENGKSFPFYLYVSLNARDSKKATFLLLNKIHKWLEEETDGVDRSAMFKKIHGHFYSALMTEASRTKHQRYFMLDIDTKSYDSIANIRKELNKIDAHICMEQETKNGWHFKTEPFNRILFYRGETLRLFNVEVKTDANFFVEYVENKE